LYNCLQIVERGFRVLINYTQLTYLARYDKTCVVFLCVVLFDPSIRWKLSFQNR